MKTKLLLLGICLCVRVAAGGESVASFVNRSLGFDLGSVSFGSPTNADFRQTSSPALPSPLDVDSNLTWMTGVESKKYTQMFPQRALKYGFRDGRLVAVRISVARWTIDDEGRGIMQTVISVNGTNTVSSDRDERSRDLFGLWDQLHTIFPPQKSTFEDSNFRLQYGAMCAPMREALEVIEIQITPREAKQ